ncbi:helix-turn-helix domain-containing protein [Evtepia gabavorous]|uniref:helix-turn-helix domain-containing protein n=1 Tax=Evtepia gabavorous TaxID=2211183 RepID=UPI003A8F62CB
MNYNPKEFGMRITKLRKELGKTQQETADLLHTSLDNYRGIEKGRRNPSLDLLVAMSAAFGVSLDRLVLGRMTLTDRNHVQRELEDIMIQISRLKDSI